MSCLSAHKIDFEMYELSPCIFSTSMLSVATDNLSLSNHTQAVWSTAWLFWLRFSRLLNLAGLILGFHCLITTQPAFWCRTKYLSQNLQLHPSSKDKLLAFWLFNPSYPFSPHTHQRSAYFQNCQTLHDLSNQKEQLAHDRWVFELILKCVPLHDKVSTSCLILQWMACTSSRFRVGVCIRFFFADISLLSHSSRFSAGRDQGFLSILWIPYSHVSRSLIVSDKVLAWSTVSRCQAASYQSVIFSTGLLNTFQCFSCSRQGFTLWNE